MKSVAFAVSVAFLVIGTASVAKAQTESAEQELINLENGWAEALVKRDVAFLDRILADDFMTTSSRGIVSTKAQILAGVKSSAYVYISITLDDIQVRIYGDVAMVTGRNTVKSMRNGRDISGQERWTDTWIRHDGRWQAVATHNSKIAQE